jgi:deazaflavin-dependent oxidoreductase (nitroreductase family)
MSDANQHDEPYPAIATLLATNERVIEEFRAHDGVVAFANDAGAEMCILHTRGAKTGVERLTPLGWIDVDGQMVIIASFTGRPNHPAWYHNLVAYPDATVELGTENRPVHARVTSGAERTRLWDAVIAKHAGFGNYEKLTAGHREIPVIVLEPR